MADANSHNVFISYSHEDETFLKELRKHLKPYLRNGVIYAWDDKKIEPGSEWFGEIVRARESAKVAVLLASPAFLASDFIDGHELGPLLKKAREGGVRILWIQVRACSYKLTPLKDLQGIMLGEKPLAEQPRAKRDRWWVRVCEEIHKALNRPDDPPKPEPQPTAQISTQAPPIITTGKSEGTEPVFPSVPPPPPIITRPKSPLIQPVSTTESFTNSLGRRFTLIPAGTFTMGSDFDEDDEKPAHEVTITRPFWLGVYQVTQSEYREIMGKNPSYFADEGDGKAKVAGLDTSRFPVESVSWFDAVTFCNKLSERENRTPCYRIKGENVTLVEGDGYRLPSEAEWEFACRAGGAWEFSIGDYEMQLNWFAWYHENSGGRPHPVGEKAKNEFFDLYDMHGNVWEWCWDAYDTDYYRESPPTDPLGPAGAAGPSGASSRVIRGGSWYDSPGLCRPAIRIRTVPGYRDFYLGFRLAAVR